MTKEYPKPSVTVDTIIFALDQETINILLIQRKHDPFQGKWAIPGGFVEIDEPLEDEEDLEVGEDDEFDDEDGDIDEFFSDEPEEADDGEEVVRDDDEMERRRAAAEERATEERRGVHKPQAVKKLAAFNQARVERAVKKVSAVLNRPQSGRRVVGKVLERLAKLSATERAEVMRRLEATGRLRKFLETAAYAVKDGRPHHHFYGIR